MKDRHGREYTKPFEIEHHTQIEIDYVLAKFYIEFLRVQSHSTNILKYNDF